MLLSGLDESERKLFTDVRASALFFFPVEMILPHLQNNLGQRSALSLSLFLIARWINKGYGPGYMYVERREKVQVWLVYFGSQRFFVELCGLWPMRILGNPSVCKPFVVCAKNKLSLYHKKKSDLPAANLQQWTFVT